MKNIKFLFIVAVLGLSAGLQAVEKVGFINNSGQDLFARIRTQRSENNVMVIHPTLNQDPHGVLNPIPNNPEVFLLKDKGVVFVATHRLGRDLRARIWKTDYVPTVDDMTLTSAENNANSLTSRMIKAAELHTIQSQLLIYSINPDNAQRASHRVSSDSYAQNLANNEYAYVMDLEATEYSEIYGKVSLPNEYQSLT